MPNRYERLDDERWRSERGRSRSPREEWRAAGRDYEPRYDREYEYRGYGAGDREYGRGYEPDDRGR